MQYFYGQGKVYLATRNQKGEAINMRWVGDVGELSFELTTEELKHQESHSGQRAVAKRINLGKDGSLNMKWFDHSAENLAFLLYGEVINVSAGQMTETITRDISAGERITLKHINVKDVVIDGFSDGVDYHVDAKYGTITLTNEHTSPIEISYKYGASKSTPMFTTNPPDVFFRYEGVNLAEDGAPVVVEFYKVQFSPAQAINLINNDTSLNGLQTKAGVLYDSERDEDSALGRYGRILTGA